jgi:DNA-binding NarL/FixJ family response regulator
MSLITVLLAEDHLIVREGLRALFNLETDMKIVGEAENGRQAVSLVCQFCPDVVVMDIAMPLLNGLAATRQILQTAPSTKVLMLSAHSDDSYIEQAMALGAAGYLIKQTAADVLPKAIREVHQGRPYFSPCISQRVKNHDWNAPFRGDLPGRKAFLLTSRETEVLQLIAEGKANKQTANELYISAKTV